MPRGIPNKPNEENQPTVAHTPLPTTNNMPSAPMGIAPGYTPGNYPGQTTVQVPHVAPPETITITKTDLQGLVNRAIEDATKRFKDSLNDPVPILKQRVKNHTLHVAMWNGKYVVAYKNIQTNPDSRPLYCTDEFNPNRKRIEEYVTIIFADGTEEKVCHIDFQNSFKPVKAKIQSVDVEKISRSYVAITDSGLSGDEPREVLLEETKDRRSYNVLTDDGTQMTLTEDENGWAPINMGR